MKIKIIIAIIATVGTLGLTGCKPKDTTLSGQIFIVTRGSENVKLGLVEVQLVEKQQVAEFLQKKQIAIDSEIASRKQEYTAAKSEDEKAAADLNAFQSDSPLTKPDYLKMKDKHDLLLKEIGELEQEISSKMDRFNQLIYDLQHPKSASPAPGEYPESAFLAAVQKIHAEQNEARQILEWLEKTKYDEKKQEAAQIFESMRKVASDAETKGKPLADKLAAAIMRFKTATLKNFEPYPKAETYFTNFSPIVFQKTLTDADGKFLISYPRDKAFTLFAKAQRMVGDKTENYVWLVDAPNSSEAKIFLLSNNNLVFSDPDGYFKIKPQPEAQSQATP